MTIRSASLSPYGHPRAAVPQYGRRYHREGTIMKKLSMIGTFAGSIVEPTDVPTEDILPPTEDILPPLLPPTEDILPASDNIPVRFTVGIVISAKLSHLACTRMPYPVALSVCSPRSRPGLRAVHVRAGTAFMRTKSQKRKRRACPTFSYPGN
jgi:hypothetical protein